MSFTNSLKQVFFITKLNRNRPIKISKRIIDDNINQRYNNNHDFSIYDRRRYKNNIGISIYPSPERIINNRLKPLIIKTGSINSNKKNIKPKSQYYLPIMKQKIDTDPFESFLLEDAINSSKRKNTSFKLKILKREKKNIIESEKERENDKDKDKDKDEKKEEKKDEKKEKIKEPMEPGISYSFDRFGKPILQKSSFNFDVKNIPNVKQKINNDFFSKIHQKTKSHKDQMLMRNKYQHVKNYYKKNMPILEYDAITIETNKAFDFQPEFNHINTDNNEYNIYESKEILARDLIKDKLPNIKVTGYDQLYMNAMTSVRPYDFEKRK